MTDKRDDSDRLKEAVRTRQRRREQGQRDSEPSVAQTIVVPTLIGIFLGRWLDRHFGAGVFWTFGLLVGGLALGCAAAWNRMQKI
jgi:ATP synthase protein I